MVANLRHSVQILEETLATEHVYPVSDKIVYWHCRYRILAVHREAQINPNARQQTSAARPRFGCLPELLYDLLLSTSWAIVRHDDDTRSSSILCPYRVVDGRRTSAGQVAIAA